jgi:hypothetical protein
VIVFARFFGFRQFLFVAAVGGGFFAPFFYFR